MNKVESATRQVMPGKLAAESKFQWLTRLGFAARGALYILIGVLALQTGRTEDLTGALEYVGHGAGKILLIGIAIGLGTYALWRLSDAALGTEHPGSGLKALGKRAVAGGIGAVYMYLAYKAVRILLAGRAGSGDMASQADSVLKVPGGTLVLLGVAAGFAIAAAAQLLMAVRCRFMRRLDEGAAAKSWVKWMGRLGYMARAAIFVVIAYFFYRAGIDRQATEVGNLEKALDVLRGRFLLPITAGLVLFGLFSLVEARFRRIHHPPVRGVRRTLSTRYG